MAPSRPVSGKRTIHDQPESINVQQHLMPKNIHEAREYMRAKGQEALGCVLFTSAILSLAIVSLIIWMRSYAVPYATFVMAECLVLNSTQTMLPEGFLREPLYRAEVYVYVFNTTNAECCCQDIYGRDRCGEWESIAYDNILETHTAGDKAEFLREYGYPGTFHRCWHAPDKSKVVMKRQSNSTFLIAPILAFVFGLYGVFRVAVKVRQFRSGQFYVDKYSGKGKDENALVEPEAEPLKKNADPEIDEEDLNLD